MQITVTKARARGFTLIELLVAIVILTIATLGLLEVYSKYIRINIDNVMRNEAMRITEGRLEQIRNLPFIRFTDGTNINTVFPTTVTGNVRNVVTTFTINAVVNTLSLRLDTTTPNSVAVLVTVTWNHKGMAHRHSAATVVTDEW